MRVLALIATLAVACAAPATSSPAPTAATAAPTETAAASTPRATATPRPTGTLVVAADIIARATPVPAEFRYIGGAEQPIGRVWLADLTTGAVIDVVAARMNVPLDVEFSASNDGKRVLVTAAAPGERHSALYLVEVEVGRVTLLYADPVLDSRLSPVLTQNGTLYAFADQTGVRVGDSHGGATSLVLKHDDPQRVGGTWRPVAWSVDTRWLAISRSGEAESEMAIVDVSTGRLIRLDVGTAAAWRSRSPELLVASSTGPFGGQSKIYTYEVASSRTSVLQGGGTLRIGSLEWHPMEDRYLYTSSSSFAPGDTVLTGRLGTQGATTFGTRKVLRAWWSRDGSKIYGLVMRADALATAGGAGNYEVIDVGTGAVVATVCRGDPRATCP